MKNNENIKDELRTAATIAVGPTEQEAEFWGEVDRLLAAGRPTKQAPEVEPRLTGKRE